MNLEVSVVRSQENELQPCYLPALRSGTNFLNPKPQFLPMKNRKLYFFPS